MSLFDFIMDSKVATCLFEIKKRPNLPIDVYSVYLKAFLPEEVSSRWIVDTIDLMIESKLLHYCHKDGTVEVTPDGSFIAGLLFRIRRECEDIEESLEV